MGEGPERAAGELEVGGIAEDLAAAGQRLDRRALREPADPRRAAAAEAEVVLPGGEARAGDGQGADGVERGAQLVGIAGARLRPGLRAARVGQRVGAAERRELLELQALAGIPLVDDRIVAEHHPGAAQPRLARARAHGGHRGARDRLRGPVLGVARQLHEDDGHARGGQHAPRGEALDAGDDGRQLALAQPGEPVADDAGVAVGGLVAVAVGRGQGARALEAAEGGQNGRPARGGDGGGRAARRPADALGDEVGRGGQGRVVAHDGRPARLDDGHLGRPGAGSGRGEGEHRGERDAAWTNDLVRTR
jgi:hypothetical protein